MNDYDAHKAFSLLWSVTNKIFEHVADIQNLFDKTGIPVTGSSSDDPPPCESSASENLISQLKRNFSCLEDLNKQRKLLYHQYSKKRSGCGQVRNVHSEEEQQVWNMKREFKLTDAPTPRDVAIKNLRSCLRTRRASAKANRVLLAQIKQGLSDLQKGSFKYLPNPRTYEWYPEEEKKFYTELRLMGLFSSQLTEDHFSLLRDGRILEEKIMSLSHDTGEETSKLMRNVQDSYRKAEELVVPTFFDLLLPILKNLPGYNWDSSLKPVVKSVVKSIKSFSEQYGNAVEAYQDALQDLLDFLAP